MIALTCGICSVKGSENGGLTEQLDHSRQSSVGAPKEITSFLC
jgi:hypothetical protein